jgi:hypothetical protein
VAWGFRSRLPLWTTTCSDRPLKPAFHPRPCLLRVSSGAVRQCPAGDTLLREDSERRLSRLGWGVCRVPDGTSYRPDNRRPSFAQASRALSLVTSAGVFPRTRRANPSWGGSGGADQETAGTVDPRPERSQGPPGALVRMLRRSLRGDPNVRSVRPTVWGESPVGRIGLDQDPRAQSSRLPDVVSDVRPVFTMRAGTARTAPAAGEPYRSTVTCPEPRASGPRKTY